VVYVGTVAIGLTIIEMSEELEARNVNGVYVPVKDQVSAKRAKSFFDTTWTLTHAFPTGRLCLQAYSPYYGAKWKKHWRETKAGGLDGEINAVIAELEAASAEIARMVEEERRRAEVERQRWEAEWEEYMHLDAARKAAEARKDARDELLRIIDQWAESTRVEQFFSEAEKQLSTFDEDIRLQLLDRLRHARDLIGSTDALGRFMAWKFPAER